MLFHGNLFEFFRNESLNARNYFQASNPVKPDYRRNQYGGMFGGPLVKNRTFFFVDYQGQRQSIGRTVTSNVPTLAERSGVFRQNIYDPRTTVGNTRQQFLNNTIPGSAMDPVALSLLDRYPRPTTTGTANNYSRTANEIDDQDQGDVRIDHKFGTGRDQAFGRLTYFRGHAEPVTAFPDGSGTILAGSVAVGPQDTTSWAFASNYQHTFSPNVLNEVRIGDTRRAVQRSAVELPTFAGTALNIPGIPSNAQFPNTMPTFAPNGYQQLGSPTNTASDFSTSVTQIADSLTWLKGRHTMKMGLDWRWERLDVSPTPIADGTVCLQHRRQRSTRRRGHRQRVCELPAGTGADLFHRPPADGYSGTRAAFRSTSSRTTGRCPIASRSMRGCDTRSISRPRRSTVKPPYSIYRRGSSTIRVRSRYRPLKKDNFGPRLGAIYRLTDKTIVSSGYGKVWIEMAGITTPFTTPNFPFLQTVSQRTLDNITPAFVLANGPTVTPIALTPTAGLGQGVFTVDAGLGSGYAQQWNVSVQRELTANTVVEVSYLGSKITNIGIPDSNINQLTEEQLRLGQALLTPRVPNPYVGIIPPSSTIGDPTLPPAQLMKPFPEYTAVSFYRNNVGTTNYQGLAFSIRQRMSGGLTYSAAYTRSKLTDIASSVFDASILTGPLTNAAVADSHNLERDRDYSTGDIPHYFAASVVWDLPVGEGRAKHPTGVVGALVNDWSVATFMTMQSGVPVAVTQANSLGYAGFTTQRPNLVGDPTLPADERTPGRWFNTAAFATANQFTIGSASRNPVRGPSYRDVDLAVMRRVGVGGERSIELRLEVFNLLNTANFGAPAAQLGPASFGTITTALDPRVVQLAAKYWF